MGVRLQQPAFNLCLWLVVEGTYLDTSAWSGLYLVRWCLGWHCLLGLTRWGFVFLYLFSWTNTNTGEIPGRATGIVVWIPLHRYGSSTQPWPGPPLRQNENQISSPILLHICEADFMGVWVLLQGDCEGGESTEVWDQNTAAGRGVRHQQLSSTEADTAHWGRKE